MSHEVYLGIGLTGSAHAPDLGSGAFAFDGLAAPKASLGLGREYLRDDDGLISLAAGAHAAGNHVKSAAASGVSSTPAPTVVGSSTGLQFDLIWDSSVASAPTGFTGAVIAAAQTLAADFTTREVVNIHVGYNEIAGSALGSGALGESESYGYLVSGATAMSALAAKGDSFPASNEPASAQFFLTSAETKALGFISATSTSLDGYVGFSGAYPMSYATSGSIASNQFSLYSIAEHEITEVMGRTGLENTYRYNGQTSYTPLDLFNYSKPGTLELSANGGYFSLDDGVTNLGTFNDAKVNGGDIADWSSIVTNDSFDAFTSPGTIDAMTHNDLLTVAALGYKLSSLA